MQIAERKTKVEPPRMKSIQCQKLKILEVDRGFSFGKVQPGEGDLRPEKQRISKVFHPLDGKDFFARVRQGERG